MSAAVAHDADVGSLAVPRPAAPTYRMTATPVDVVEIAAEAPVVART